MMLQRFVGWKRAMMKCCLKQMYGKWVQHDVLLQLILAFLSLMSISGRKVGQEKTGHGQEKNFTAVSEHIQANCEWGIWYCSSEPMARWSLAHSNDLLAFLGKYSVTTAFQLCCVSSIAGSISAGNFNDSSNTQKISGIWGKNIRIYLSPLWLLPWPTFISDQLFEIPLRLCLRWQGLVCEE